MDLTYDEKIEWLRRYRAAMRREKLLTQEIERLESEAAHMTQLLTGMPHGGAGGDKVPEAVERIEEARDELRLQIGACLKLRAEISAAVDGANTPRDRELLHRRYILGQRWELIAVEMHLDYRWVTRSHRRAVEQLRVNADPV